MVFLTFSDNQPTMNLVDFILIYLMKMED